MSINIKYTSHLSIFEQKQIISLLSNAFSLDTISNNTLFGFFSGYKCDHDNFILLLKNDAVVGVAIVAKRKINLLKSSVSALTVGPIAISPIYQRQGYSRMLMDAIDILASKIGVSVIYLQGIDGFYERYGYFTCSSKAKLVFGVTVKEEVFDVTIESMRPENIEDVANIYNSNAQECSCTSLRTKQDWCWLLKYACKTWYFYEPTVVLFKGRLIGYFCSDPNDSSRIRETIFDQSEEGIQLFLAGLKAYCKQKSIDKFEVMTWADSHLYAFAKKHGNSVFIQYFKNNGSQMMKIHNHFEIFKLLTDNYFSLDYVLEGIENIDSRTIFHIKFEETTFSLGVAAKYLPGLICGFLSSDFIDNLAELPIEIQDNIINFIDNLKPPFFYQGDNY